MVTTSNQLVDTHSEATAPLLPSPERSEYKIPIEQQSTRLVEVEASVGRINAQMDDFRLTMASLSSEMSILKRNSDEQYNSLKRDSDDKFNRLIEQLNIVTVSLKDKATVGECSGNVNQFPQIRQIRYDFGVGRENSMNPLVGMNEEPRFNLGNGSRGDIKFSNLEFPKFYGKHLREWVTQAACYFNWHKIPNHLKIDVALEYFRGEACLWGFTHVSKYGTRDWQWFLTALYSKYDHLVVEKVDSRNDIGNSDLKESGFILVDNVFDELSQRNGGVIIDGESVKEKNDENAYIENQKFDEFEKFLVVMDECELPESEELFGEHCLHVSAIADVSYRRMIDVGKNNSISISREGGAGKTKAVRYNKSHHACHESQGACKGQKVSLSALDNQSVGDKAVVTKKHCIAKGFMIQNGVLVEKHESCYG